MNPIFVGVLGLIAACAVASPARAASAPSDFCTGNPCVVTGTVNADAGSVVNFGGRSLVVATGATIEIGPGAPPRLLHLIADDITLQPGARIRGNSADRAVVVLESTLGAVTMQSAGNTRSEIDVRSAVIDGGNIQILAATNAVIDGRLTASASGEDASGGSIEIEAGGTATVSQDATTAGSGSFAGAGDFDLTAQGDVTITAKVSADGSDFGGGDVTIESVQGNVTIASLVSNSGGNPDGEAGEFSLLAGNNIHITSVGELRGRGGAGADDDCGDGAFTSLESGASTIVDGIISNRGGFQCFGGDVDVIAELDFVMNGSGILDNATAGAFGAGGFITIGASRNAILRQIDASSSGGFGGNIEVTSGVLIDVQQKLNARATGTEGIGGLIILSSCTVNIPATGGELDTRGAFVFPSTGTNIIQAGGPATIAGPLSAATANQIFWKSVPPVITGSISPAPTVTQNLTLPDCANSCGDGQAQEPEICDDGNLLSCDGCASDCLRPDDVCGDGIQECGEQCDDGNSVPGDGCENDCTPTGQDVTGVLIPSRGKNVGCQAQWLLQIDQPETTKKGEPSSTQTCIDGDFRCDADGQINNECRFLVAPCVNVPDEDLPECDPTRRVDHIILKKPLIGSNNGIDAVNASRIVQSLVTLGTTVESDGVVIQTGDPVNGTNVCGPEAEVAVPFSGKSGKKTLKLRTMNEDDRVLKKAAVKLKCERNDSVCGNSTVEPGELCDDGNAVSCDGCSSCRTEFCGNGTVECGEQCDEGMLNGSEGSRCSNQCTVIAPDLRIPGGGSKKTDCMLQWSMELAPGEVFTDKKDVPRNKQICRDNSTPCDFDPAPGNCRVKVFACLAGGNDQIACPAQAVDSLEVKRPKADAKDAFEVAARATLDDVLGDLPLPLAPGEVCSNAMEFDIPQGETLKVAAKAFGARKDGDSLRIVCQ